MATNGPVDTPPSLVSRRIRTGECAEFRCTMGSIGQTWGTTYREWLPASLSGCRCAG